MADRNTYALLSSRVYGASTVNKTPVPAGWTELPELVDNGFTGLYARAYRNDATGEIVIAFRGTNTTITDGMIQDWATNLSAGLGIPNGQVAQAMEFYENIKATYGVNGGSNISFTGHSLGGGIASLMAVFFDKQATVFDAAPFQPTAVNPLTVAAYAALAPSALLDPDFLVYQLNPLSIGLIFNGREENVTNYFLEGEAVGIIRTDLTAIVGESNDHVFPLGESTAGAIDRHDMLVLTAAQYSDGFLKALQKLPNLLTLLLDDNLYARNRDTTDQDILSLLLRHQFGDGTILPADGMLDGFARDLNQLTPGVLMRNAPGLEDALIKALMQGYDKLGLDQLPFTSDFYNGVTGGFYLDTNRVATSPSLIVSYSDIAQALLSYYGSTIPVATHLAATDRWYFQSGLAALDAVAEDGHNNFMGGAAGADRITGASGKDVILGGAGTDILQGNGGNDTLYGGIGVDIYRYRPGDGHDTLIDQDGRGLIAYTPNGATQALAVGLRESTDPAGQYRSPDGSVTYQVQGADLVLTTPDGGTITVRNFNRANNDLNLRLIDLPPEPPPDLPAITDITTTPSLNTYRGSAIAETTAGSAIDDDIYGQGGGDRLNGSGGDDRIETGSGTANAYADGGIGRDIVIGGPANDRLIGGPDDDTDADDAIQGGLGDDYLEGGGGNDVLAGGPGRDVLLGGRGHDILRGAAALTALDRTWSIDRWPDPIGEVRFNHFSGDLYDTDGTGDIAHGGAGHDFLLGGNGDDQLHGDADNDTLIGNGGNDLLAGGSGVDVLDGGYGDDMLLGGAGNDYLYGEGFASAPGEAGDDYLDGGAGADELHGGDGNDTLLGGTEGDRLYGGAGADTLSGGDGEDRLAGDAGADVLDGGAGRDILYTDGDDTIVFRTGSSHDLVYTFDPLNPTAEAGAVAAIVFDGITLEELSISAMVDDQGRTWLGFQIGPSDRLFVEDSLRERSQRYLLGDGTVLDQRSLLQLAPALSVLGTDGADTLYGGNRDDYLNGGYGDDRLEGQRGADTLDGGAGSDTYVFNRGDGNDEVEDSGVQAGEIDTIRFGEGIGAADLLFRRLGGSALQIEIEGSGDTITLRRSRDIERLQFADGTTLDLADPAGLPTVYYGLYGNNTVLGTSQNDTLVAAELLGTNDGKDIIDGFGGDDVLDGGYYNDYLRGGDGSDRLYGGPAVPDRPGAWYDGHDTLEGGEGGDIYLYNVGDGQDTIVETDAEGNDIDTLRFGAGIDPAGVYVERRGNDLALIVDPDHRITVQDWYASAGARVERVEFADGTVWTAAEVETRAQVVADIDDTLFGGSGDDVLLGFGGSDQLFGGGGNDLLDGGDQDDLLEGGFGDDVLDGGRGNDTLVGGPGDNDLYRIYRGGGFDEIQSYEYEGYFQRDIIEFGPGITPADLSVQMRAGTGEPFTSARDMLAIGVGEEEGMLAWHDFTLGYGGFAYGDSSTFSIQRFRFADGQELTLQQVLALADNGVIGEQPGTGGDDVLLGSVAADVISGLDGNDRIDARGNADTLDGGAGDDVLNAGGGNDIVLGGAGDDVLAGGLGDDDLSGGDGSDVYAINRGDGTDLIHDEGTTGTDSLSFDSSISPSQVAGYIDTAGVLHLCIDGSTQEIRLPWFDPANGYAVRPENEIERAQFVAPEGTRIFDLSGAVVALRESLLTASESSPVRLFAEEGSPFEITATAVPAASDFASAYASGGRLYTYGIAVLGEAGVGELFGTAGDDTIELAETAGTSYSWAGENTRIWEPGRTVYAGAGNDAITTRGGQNTIDAGDGNDRVTLTGGGSSLVLGGYGSDTFVMNGADAWALNQPGVSGVLVGGGGNDVYVYNRAPNTRIRIVDSADSRQGAGNTLRFGQGISAGGIRLRRGSLLIEIPEDGSEIHLESFDPNDVLGSRAIDTFEFADGTVLSYEELIARGFDIAGTDDGDALAGTNVADRVEAGAGNDTVTTGDGDDTLTGGPGDDLLDGGSGNDTFVYAVGDGNDTINDTAGTDTLRVGTGLSASELTADRSADDLLIGLGTGASLTVTGWFAGNRIEQFEFADGTVLLAADLEALINEAPVLVSPLADQSATQGEFFRFTVPADTFSDPDAGDTLTYSAILADGSALPAWLGFDSAAGTLSGTPDATGIGSVDIEITAIDSGGLSAADIFTLAVYPRVIEGSEGDDHLLGSPGNNELYGRLGTDILEGLAGDDRLDGGAGSDLLDGGLGDDTLVYSPDGLWSTGFIAVNSGSPGVAGTGQRVAIAGKNRSFDVFAGGEGEDMLTGGDGDDVLALDDSYSPFPGAPGPRIDGIEAIYGNGGNDVIDLTSGSYSYGDVLLDGGPGDDVLWASAGRDVLYGGDGSDHLYGGVGDDALFGGSGNDLVDGGPGADGMAGGTGNDVYIVDDLGDALMELAGQGTDAVKGYVDYTLGPNLENLMLMGTADLDGWGNGLNNVMTGNAGVNVLAGGPGNDTYIIGAEDSVVEQPGEGTDTVRIGTSHALGSNLENLVLTGTAPADATGNAANNVLTGNRAANRLDGGAGNDTLRGGLGDDIYAFQPGWGIDTVVENDTAVGNTDIALFGPGIGPLDLVFAQTGNDLRVTRHGSADAVVFKGWNLGEACQTEVFQAGVQQLLNTQVDQLIQAMAQFSATNGGITWNQAIDQRPEDVQAVLASYWQPSTG